MRGAGQLWHRLPCLPALKVVSRARQNPTACHRNSKQWGDGGRWLRAWAGEAAGKNKGAGQFGMLHNIKVAKTLGFSQDCKGKPYPQSEDCSVPHQSLAWSQGSAQQKLAHCQQAGPGLLMQPSEVTAEKEVGAGLPSPRAVTAQHETIAVCNHDLFLCGSLSTGPRPLSSGPASPKRKLEAAEEPPGEELSKRARVTVTEMPAQEPPSKDS